jgi:hypothetical protein
VTARALLLPIMLVAACGSSERAPTAEGKPVVVEVPREPPRELDSKKTDTEPPPSPPLEPVTVRPIPGADADGPVYLVINTKGVAKLDERGVTLVLDKPERNIQSLFVGPDGAPYLVDARSLRKLEGDSVREVVRFGFDDVAPVDELALALDGSIWVTGSRGVGHYHGGRWTVSSREQLGLGFNTDVAVALDGTVWVAGSTKLLRRPAGVEGQEWTTVDLSPLGRVPLLLEMSMSPTGSVLATNGKQLIRLAGEQPELTPLAGAERIAYTADLSIAADGTVALASGTCELVRLPPDGRGEAWRFGRDGYACETLEAMAIDGRRRIWVAAREGLSVIDEGGRVVEYPAGSFPSLAGRVSHMVVLGRGPDLPSAPELSKASLIGRIELAKAPLANAKREACPTVQLLADGSPCSVAKLRFTGTTDARGNFRLDEVPIGDYSFAVEIDGVWRWTSPPSFAAQMRAGEAHDLGTLALAKL